MNAPITLTIVNTTVIIPSEVTIAAAIKGTGYMIHTTVKVCYTIYYHTLIVQKEQFNSIDA